MTMVSELAGYKSMTICYVSDHVVEDHITMACSSIGYLDSAGVGDAVEHSETRRCCEIVRWCDATHRMTTRRGRKLRVSSGSIRRILQAL